MNDASKKQDQIRGQTQGQTQGQGQKQGQTHDNGLTFGAYIRDLRLRCGLGQRELSRLIGVSAAYLNDIEKDKRPAPKNELLSLLHEKLEADANILNDLAGKSKNTIPPDIFEVIIQKPETIDLLRMIKSYGLNGNQIHELDKIMTSMNAKAIIIAAGMGSRLKEHTKDLPKCMLSIDGKTLLQRQLDSYHDCGINNIALVRGYKAEKINYDGIRYYKNPDFRKNNILNSLFYAEEEIQGNVVISYSDILFESSVVKRLLASQHDISIVVDIDWRGLYENRKDHPVEEAEKVIFNANNEVIDIGKVTTGLDDVYGEFIGMLKLTDRGAEIFKKHFHRCKELYWNKPFQRAKTFQNAYITDFIKEMTELGVPVHCVLIERGWREIDTVEDYKKSLNDFKSERRLKAT